MKSSSSRTAHRAAVTDDSPDRSNEKAVLKWTGGEGYTVGSPSAHRTAVGMGGGERSRFRLNCRPWPVPYGWMCRGAASRAPGGTAVGIAGEARAAAS